ncbi:MAG: hydrogenase expression/formation protein HypE [Thermodesulfovibrionales bacterium]|nr:hydrogenase expression/formation protein HypE [Thermodesulfovibrionales bacterium]
MDKILLGHGSGGTLMHRLIEEIAAPSFDIAELNDSAKIDINGQRLAFSTDSYVVSPIFFPGGNIGDLAANGTVNDLAVVGAIPICLSAGFILEEGLPIDTLREIISTMSKAAKEAGVKIITGDTKVVERAKGDGIYINTSGIGFIPNNVDLGPHKIQVGDTVIVSGMIGRHGIAVLAKRNGLYFDPPVLSDCAALNSLTQSLLQIDGAIKMMRDPTRGGVATTLKEIAIQSKLNIEIDENSLPIPSAVNGACELLGLDPLYVANEGILIAIVDKNKTDEVIEKMKNHPLGIDSSIIGRVVEPSKGRDSLVIMNTNIGGRRLIEMLAGEQLTRIC